MYPLIAVMLVCAAPSLSAQSLPPVPDFDRVNWQAVGVVNQDGDTGLANCSGVLVAPTLVLTAAHCAGISNDTGEKRAFVVGGTGSGPGGVFFAFAVTLHPDYTQVLTDLKRFAVDLALLTLTEPVPASMARALPLAVVAPGSLEDARFAILGFDRMFPDRLKGRFDCVASGPGASKQLRLKCPVTNGNSGAPVLIETDTGWQIFGVVAARIGRGADSQTLVAIGDTWLAEQVAAATAP